MAFIPTYECRAASAGSTAEHVQQLLQLWRHYTNILPVDDITVKNIASDICRLLSKTNSLEALSVFLNELPTTTCSWKNENILRARVKVALNEDNTDLVKRILKENHFTKADQLIDLWDKAHYIEEERRTGKKLTPLIRFRVRKRFPPPHTICPSGVRKSSSLPRESTSYLKTWLMNHRQDPYPSVVEKQQLARVSGLTINQVKTWFANARRRSKSNDDLKNKFEDHLSTGVIDDKADVTSTPRKEGVVEFPSPPSSVTSSCDEASQGPHYLYYDAMHPENVAMDNMTSATTTWYHPHNNTHLRMEDSNNVLHHHQHHNSNFINNNNAIIRYHHFPPFQPPAFGGNIYQ